MDQFSNVIGYLGNKEFSRIAWDLYEITLELSRDPNVTILAFLDI